MKLTVTSVLLLVVGSEKVMLTQYTVNTFDSITTVSYTHLDVYKRQDIFWFIDINKLNIHEWIYVYLLLSNFVRRHFVVATYTYKIIKRPGSYKRTGETDYGCLNKENFTCFPRITEVLLLIRYSHHIISKSFSNYLLHLLPNSHQKETHMNKIFN